MFAGMAELADAHGSGPCGSNTMRVQVSFPARKALADARAFLVPGRAALPENCIDSTTVIEFIICKKEGAGDTAPERGTNGKQSDLRKCI